MICPICRVMTVGVEEKGIMAARCPACGGIWISAVALGRLTRKVVGEGVEGVAGTEVPLAELAEKVTRSNSTGEVECPYCQKGMVKERFHPMVPVEVDRCEKCVYVWLDAGEQELLLVLYRQLMSEDDPGLAEKREKLKRLEELRGQMVPMTQADEEIGRVVSGGQLMANMGMNVADDLARGATADLAVDVGAFLVNLLVK